jgi:hypothetical protein
MNKDPKFLLIVLQTVIIGSLLVFLVLLTYQNINEKNALDISRQMEYTQIDSLKQVIKGLNMQGGIAPLLDEYQVRNLKRKGLDNPVEDIRNDLMREGALISRKGTQGGTMKFYLPEAIHVLTENWVIAYFEDGHNAGALILKYDVVNGDITWEVLDEISY